jgi:ABC-type cobalamin/Fe3+-siderophores transport system ATPase subunit
MTTLFVTHDLRQLPSTCQRLVLMKQGKIWRQGTPELILKKDVLTQLYGAPVAAPNRVSRS